MSANENRPASFGEELLRVIRAEIADYDARKAKQSEAKRLQRVADAAARDADNPPLLHELVESDRVRRLNAFADRFTNINVQGGPADLAAQKDRARRQMGTDPGGAR